MSTRSTSWETLSGAYQLCPGRERSIVGERPVLGAGRLANLVRGQKGEQVGQTLASVFTLCAHAHRRAAGLALAAAQAGSADSPPTDAAMLLLDTARDHLRAIALEWPQHVAGLPPTALDLGWLRDCPLPLAGARKPEATQASNAIAALRDWLEQRILLEPAARWLARHGDDPAALADWCAAHASRLSPARCLAAWHPLAHALAPETRCLDLLDDEPRRQSGELRALAQALDSDPDFVQQPVWQGQCAETGPWARLRHRRKEAPAGRTTWTRLSSRWLELVEIAAADPGAPPLLASGALALGGGQAIAWCEMARGLLVHWVRLDAQGGVEDYRVLAPTEWNFHPAGALARALAQLDPADTDAARTLAAAYDPCVACSVIARD